MNVELQLVKPMSWCRLIKGSVSVGKQLCRVLIILSHLIGIPIAAIEVWFMTNPYGPESAPKTVPRPAVAPIIIYIVDGTS